MERYQTFGKRILAVIIDSFLIYTPSAIFYFWMGFTDSETSTEAEVAVNLGSALLGSCYVIFFHWVFGQTIGKMATKLKVVEVTGEGNISFGQAILRDIFFIVDGIIRFGVYGYILFFGLSLANESAAAMEFYLPIVFVVWDVVNAIICFKHPKNRAVHDMIAGTVVVRLDVPNEREEIASRYLEPPGPDTYEDLGEPRK